MRTDGLLESFPIPKFDLVGRSSALSIVIGGLEKGVR